ncbi:hypothetical protein GCM10009716_03920 [Streptomyces sodiiphilus]|uniref:Lipoprotein n=1 Tax=Streptomyces sodiiphilus TaxID=226217 RepID=A0ABN2NQZ2_9ACTN
MLTVLAVLSGACAAGPEMDRMVGDLAEFRVHQGVYAPAAPVERSSEEQTAQDISALFFAAALADSVLKGREVVGAEGVAAAREHGRMAADSGNCDGMLFSAGVLRIVQERDPRVERMAASCTLERLAEHGVTRENVGGVAVALGILERMGYSGDIPELTMELFDVEDREDRYRAWQALALMPRLDNPEDTREHFSEQLAEAAVFLRNPDSDALLGEVIAAYQAPRADRDMGGLSPELERWLSDARGCEGADSFYRVSPEADVCTLEDAWTGVTSGLIPR